MQDRFDDDFFNNEENNENLILTLDEYIDEIEETAEYYGAVQIFFSGINQNNFSAPQLEIITQSLGSLLSSRRGRIFNMNNKDVIIIFSKKMSGDIESFLIKLIFTFSKDPLIEKYGKEKFIKRYDLALETDFDRIYDIAHDENYGKKLLINEKLGENSVKAKKTIDNLTENKTQFLSLKEVAQIQNNLSSADFSNMIRRRPVCIIFDNSAPQILFEEILVSIEDLKNILFPAIPFNFEINLFHYLTETIDKRLMLSINRHDDGFLTKNFGFHLNVKTILSDDFLKFDSNILSSLKPTIVIELNLSDIFSEIGSYIMARNFLYEQGYKICLNTIKESDLPLINISELGIDFVKIRCSETTLDKSKLEILKSNINKIGKEKVIMSYIESSAELSFAQELGLNLFQGKYIHNLLNESLTKFAYKKPI